MRIPAGAKWRAYFELKSGATRYLLPCSTQKQAWKSIGRLFVDPDAPEWVKRRGPNCDIANYGIEPIWEEEPQS